MIEFGPEEPVTVADLRVGDFVVGMAAQAGIRGFRAMSGVKTVEERSETWYMRTTPRHRVNVPSRAVTFLDAKLAAVDLPTGCVVVARRIIETEVSA